jgi:hypothetical protein
MPTPRQPFLPAINLTSLIAGVSAGAALMFVFDPARGAARRARLSDQFAHFIRRAGQSAQAAALDIANRGRGAIHGVLDRRHHGAVLDDVLVARIRSAIGRLVTHPGSVHVMIDNDAVRLDGPVLRGEMEPVLAAVSRLTAGKPIQNGLVVREPGHVPGLQGAGTPPRHGVGHKLRSPGVRLLLGVAACGVAAWMLTAHD